MRSLTRVRPGLPGLALVLALAIPWMASGGAVAQSPSPGAATGVPFADVPSLLGGPLHHGVQAGPGPVGPPVLRWSFREADGVKTSPILVDGVLIVGGLDRTLRGIDPATGTELWRTTLPGEVGRGGDSAGGLTYWPDGAGGVQAVEATTGAVRWRTDVGATPDTNPAVVDGVVFVGTTAGAVGLDALTGTPVWSWPTGTPVRTVTVTDGRAIFGSEDRVVHAVSLSDDTELWRVPARSGSIGPAVVDGDRLYLAALQPLVGDPSSELMALDAATGEVVWRLRSTSGRSVSPLGFRDGVLYVSTEDEGLLAVRADDGARLWQAPMGQVLHGFAIVGDRLYAAARDGTLRAVELTDGSIAWQLPIARDTRTTPVVSGGMVFVAQEDGTIAAYGDAPAGGPAASPLASRLPASVTPSPAPSAAPETPIALEVVAVLGPSDIPDLAHPFTMDVAPDGTVVVVNGAHDEILVLDGDGRLLRRWGSTGSEPGQFRFRRDGENTIGGVAVAPDGTIYVADLLNYRVQAFTPDGTFLRRWGAFGTGDGQFIDPVGIAVAPDGSVLVVDDERDDIQRFTPDGGYLQTIGSHGSGDGQLHFTAFIEVMPDGTVLNADYGNERVQAWDADGHFLWSLGEGGTGPGEFRGVIDVDTDAAGNLWVADKHRVQVFSPDRELRIGTWTEPGGTLDDELSNLVLTGDGAAWVSKGWGHELMKLRVRLP